MSWRWLTMLAVLCLVSAVIRSVGLWDRSLWFDEAMSWRTSRLPWNGMFASIKLNTHAPLYFVVLKFWMLVFGESILALRSLNLVITTATVPVVWLCTQRLCGGSRDTAVSVSLIATCLFALNPYQIRLAEELRMYPLLVVLTLLSTIALLAAIESPRRSCHCLAFALLACSTLYTHYFGLFIVASQLAYWAIRGCLMVNDRKRTFAWFLSTTLMVCIGFLPWLPSFLS